MRGMPAAATDTAAADRARLLDCSTPVFGPRKLVPDRPTGRIDTPMAAAYLSIVAVRSFSRPSIPLPRFPCLAP
jgi:hypothetical protein